MKWIALSSYNGNYIGKGHVNYESVCNGFLVFIHWPAKTLVNNIRYLFTTLPVRGRNILGIKWKVSSWSCRKLKKIDWATLTSTECQVLLMFLEKRLVGLVQSQRRVDFSTVVERCQHGLRSGDFRGQVKWASVGCNEQTSLIHWRPHLTTRRIGCKRL